MILLVHADTTTNERRAVEHVYTHVLGYTHVCGIHHSGGSDVLGAVRGCSCLRPRMGKSISALYVLGICALVGM